MKKLTPVKQYLLGFSMVFLVLLISAGTVLYLSMKPKLDAERTATQVLSLIHISRCRRS